MRIPLAKCLENISLNPLPHIFVRRLSVSEYWKGKLIVRYVKHGVLTPLNTNMHPNPRTQLPKSFPDLMGNFLVMLKFRTTSKPLQTSGVRKAIISSSPPWIPPRVTWTSQISIPPHHHPNFKVRVKTPVRVAYQEAVSITGTIPLAHPCAPVHPGGKV